MANASVITLTTESFDDQVLKSEQPVLVDFWAEWCGPCRMLGPVIEELASEYEGKARVCKLNVDNEGALAARYGVMSIPTVIAFTKGKESERFVGVRPKSAYSEFLDSLL